MIKIIPKLLDPAWVADMGSRFAKLFELAPEAKQSGIHILNVPHYNTFRNDLWQQLGGLNLGHWLADYCSIRSQPPNAAAKGLPWHQDSAVVLGRTFGWIRGTVVWIPFTPINSFITPTIQIANTRWPMRHRGNQTTGYLESLHAPRGEKTLIEKMDLGDVLLFDINHPHRTFVQTYMYRSRISADLRFTKHVPWSYHGKIIG